MQILIRLHDRKNNFISRLDRSVKLKSKISSLSKVIVNLSGNIRSVDQRLSRNISLREKMAQDA